MMLMERGPAPLPVAENRLQMFAGPQVMHFTRVRPAVRLNRQANLLFLQMLQGARSGSIGDLMLKKLRNSSWLALTML